MKNIAGLLVLIRDAYGQLADECYEGMVQALYILFGLLHSYLTSYVFSCSNCIELEDDGGNGRRRSHSRDSSAGRATD